MAWARREPDIPNPEERLGAVRFHRLGDVQKLFRHMEKANRIQFETGKWMVESVCEQDEEFQEHWNDLVLEKRAAHGL